MRTSGVALWALSAMCALGASVSLSSCKKSAPSTSDAGAAASAASAASPDGGLTEAEMAALANTIAEGAERDLGSASAGALQRVHLEYFPHEFATLAKYGEQGDDSPHVASALEFVGDGCKPDFENCGVIFTGEASDAVAQPMKCASTPAPVDVKSLAGAAPLIERWRDQLAKNGEGKGTVKVGDVVEVAKVQLDDDDVLDRALAVSFSLALSDEEEAEYPYGAPRCVALMLETKGRVVAVDENACVKPYELTATQAFTVKGQRGVFLHVRTREPGANGAMLFLVDNGTVSKVPLPDCAGNG